MSYLDGTPRQLSPAAYSRSSTQASLKSTPPPPPNPSIKRRLQLSLSPSKHGVDDPSSRPATKPKPTAGVPTAAKSSTPVAVPPPPVGTRLKLAPPPPRAEGVTAQPAPPAKATTADLQKAAQPASAAMPKPAQPTPAAIPKPPQLTPPAMPKADQPPPAAKAIAPPQTEDRCPPEALAKHSPQAPAPKSAPEEHRSAPEAHSQQHAPKEKRVTWTDQSVAPEATHEPSAEDPSRAVPEAPAASPAVSDAGQGGINTAQPEQQPPADTSKTPGTTESLTCNGKGGKQTSKTAGTTTCNGKGGKQKHEAHSPTKKEPISSPDAKKAPPPMVKAAPAAPATPKPPPSPSPKAASKAAPAVAGQASAPRSQQPPAPSAALDVGRVSVDAQVGFSENLRNMLAYVHTTFLVHALYMFAVLFNLEAATPVVPGSYNERQALQGEFKRRGCTHGPIHTYTHSVVNKTRVQRIPILAHCVNIL